MAGAPAGASGASADCQGVVTLDHARRVVAQGAEVIDVAEVRPPDVLPRPWRDGTRQVRYEFDVSACQGHEAAALWLFRAGAPYRISDDQGRPLVLLSARPLLRPDALPGGGSLASEQVYNGRIPALFALPPGARRVVLELQTLTYLPAGVIRVRLGPADQLLPVQAEAVEDVVAYADAASGIVLVIGVLTLLLWLQRRRDRALLWLAVACGLWGVRGLAYFGHAVYLRPLAFEQFNPLNVLLAAATLAASVLAMVDARPAARRAVLGVTLAGSAALMASVATGQGALAARLLALAGGFGMVVAAMVGVWRDRVNWTRWRMAVLQAGLGGLLVCAVHDMAVVAGLLPPDHPSYVFWGFVALLVGYATLSGQYVVATLNRAERSNEELERHVARKSEELAQSYERLRDSEREAARVQERERLLREMHDGLGAQLMTALRGVERGALSPPEVARSLQDGLDELRMLMDSADLGQYLPGALAAWRNRWDPRLAAAGIALRWRVDESLDTVTRSSETALQVMRILQEAAANVVKHAGARGMAMHARVDAGAEGPVLRLDVEDDGRGLPASPPAAGTDGRVGMGRGLRNMAHRAALIGARLQVGPGEDGAGTRVRLELKV